MKTASHAVLRKSRRFIVSSSLFLGALLFAAVVATLLIRSNTAFSYFTRLEVCALCGLEQTYRETCILDQPILRLTSNYENGVSKIFRPAHAQCGHNFHTLQEHMTHFSIHRTPKLIKRQYGNDPGSDVFSHPNYVAALSAIHATRPEIAELIWHRTFRHFVDSRTNAINQIRTNLKAQNTETTQAFLTTNRYFLPIRPNPEAWFNSLPKN
ncbi:MAG TPA: hypothetical protein VM735_00630 [Candidatus Kapabacteria bacterium]|nr:hypothetical protein [Candidatus Kapabacteria bacterium]